MKRLFLLSPLLFAVTVIALTFVQADFLRNRLGWTPATALDWPSGLALGPYGWWMTAAFIFSGIIMFIFALRLRTDLKPGIASQLGCIFLACSGLGLAALAFPTDPTLSTITRTWHGILHDLSYALLGLTLLPAMILLGKAFRNESRWQNLSLYTWVTAGLAVPAFIMKGFAFYFFLALLLAWTEVIAARYYLLNR